MTALRAPALASVSGSLIAPQPSTSRPGSGRAALTWVANSKLAAGHHVAEHCANLAARGWCHGGGRKDAGGSGLRPSARDGRLWRCVCVWMSQSFFADPDAFVLGHVHTHIHTPSSPPLSPSARIHPSPGSGMEIVEGDSRALKSGAILGVSSAQINGMRACEEWTTKTHSNSTSSFLFS